MCVLLTEFLVVAYWHFDQPAFAGRIIDTFCRTELTCELILAAETNVSDSRSLMLGGNGKIEYMLAWMLFYSS